MTVKKTVPALLLITLLLLTCLAGCRKEAPQIRTLADLQGATIATETGSVHAAAVKTHPLLSDCELLYGYSNADCVAYLMSGKAKGVALDYLMARTIAQQFEGLVQLEETLSPAEYSFAFPKGSAYCHAFGRVLAEMRADGRLDALVQKWTAGEDDSLTPQSWPGTNGTLCCQIDPSVEPMCYVAEDGSYRGLDVDILLEIARELDLRIDFTVNQFDDLIPSLLAGQADLAASGITVTEEREKLVDFCGGYLDASTVILVADGSAAPGSSLFVTIGNSFRRTFLEENRWLELLKGLGTTLWLAALTAVLGLLLGIAMYLWKFSRSRVAARVLPALVRLMTLMPLSTWLLVCYYLIFPVQSGQGYAAAIFGLTITYACSSFSTLAGNLDSIPQGQLDAAASIGYTRKECLRYIMLPRALASIVGDLDAQTVYHIRDTSLVSFVAVLDIQAVADGIGARTAEPFLPIVLTALVYILLNLLVSTLLRRLSKRLAAAGASGEKWARLEKEVTGHDPR